MKIAFLGASVTAQSVHHASGETTGYPLYLAELLAPMLSRNIEIKQFAYPGNRFSDGAVLYVNTLIEWQPDLCVVEPLQEDCTRGENLNIHHMEYVFSRLAEHFIPALVFLLPHQHTLSPNGFPAYSIIKEFCFANEIHCCDLSLSTGLASALLRDGVHTNSEGAKYYARTLLGPVLSAINDMSAQKSHIPRLKARIRLTNSMLFRDKAFTSLAISISSGTSNPIGNIVLLQHQLIGLHSPNADVRIISGNGSPMATRINVWDPYCHYNRESIVSLYRGRVTTSSFVLSIGISSEPPDYASSRSPIPFPPSVHSLFFQGIGPIYALHSSEHAPLLIDDAT